MTNSAVGKNFVFKISKNAMLTLKNLSLTTASSTLIFFATTLPSAAVSFYSITELPFRPSDINDNGQIVGENYLWTNGNITDFHQLIGQPDFYKLIYDLANITEQITGNDYSSLITSISKNPRSIQLTAINNQGKIVGYWGDSIIGEQPFIADDTDIKKINGLYLIPNDINDNGQMALVKLPVPQWLRYGATGLFRDVDGTLTNLFSARAILGMALNNSGQVIGNGGGAGVRHSWFYDNGQAKLLFPTEVLRENTFHIPLTVSSINDRGQIVGFGNLVSEPQDLYSPPIHGLLWNNPEQNPVGTDLGSIGGSYSQANSINNLGQIVGASGTNSRLTSAVIWEENSIYDLNNLIDNNLGWELTSALKINNKGQIIGSGNLNGQSGYFLLTPTSKSVPESSSAFSLLSFAAFGIGWQIKRQRNQKKQII